MALRLEVTSAVRKHVSLVGMLGVGPVVLRPAAEQTSMTGVGPMALRRASENQRQNGVVVNVQTRMMVVMLGLRQVWAVGGVATIVVRTALVAVRRCLGVAHQGTRPRVRAWKTMLRS